MLCATAVFAVLVLFPHQSFSLDNGLARTPPMGWLTWERFRCNTDCKNEPDFCISENLMKQMSDRMAADGFKDAGYEYVIVDDCWLSHERTAAGQLQPDPERFPSGIKALADYVHGKGLKFGIYEDFGTKTCGGYPGSEYYLQMDANTFASWGVDYMKLDGCNSNVNQYADAYPIMGQWLNRTGRPILYSCSWPAYISGKLDYKPIAQSCNIWRNYADIQDSWDSLIGIIDYYGKNANKFLEVAGPGNFNDPDMLILGNFGLSYDQERVQMGMWAIMASPLIMSNDLRNLRPASKALLLNKNVIAINQDPLGIQGTRIQMSGNIQIWTRKVSPAGSLAFAFLNSGTGGTPSKVSITIKGLGLTGSAGYNITEVFDNKPLGTFKRTDTFSATVNPTGIFLAKATPLK